MKRSSSAKCAEIALYLTDVSPPALTAVKDAPPCNRNNGAMERLVLFERGHDRARINWLWLGGVAATATIVATLLVCDASPRAHATDLTLVYVGAEDCAPCRAWQSGDGAAFRQSDEF